jgi:hypothetical protein
MDSRKYCAARADPVRAGARLRRRPIEPFPFAVDRRLVHRADGRLAQCENDNVGASAEAYLPDSLMIMMETQ